MVAPHAPPDTDPALQTTPARIDFCMDRPELPPLPQRLGSEAASEDGSPTSPNSMGAWVTAPAGFNLAKQTWASGETLVMPLEDIAKFKARGLHSAGSDASRRGATTAQAKNLRRAAGIVDMPETPVNARLPADHPPEMDGQALLKARLPGGRPQVMDSQERQHISQWMTESTLPGWVGEDTTTLGTHTMAATEGCMSDDSGSEESVSHDEVKAEKTDPGSSRGRANLRRACTGKTSLEAPVKDSRCTELASKPWFEPFFACIIALHMAVMALEMQYYGIDHGFVMNYPDIGATASDTYPHAEFMFDLLEWLFGVVFLLELIIKVWAKRNSFFRDYWNLLDIVIVAFWLVCSIMNEVVNLDRTLLRVLRLVRLLRIIRLVRTLQSFESLYLMMTSIKASILALMWSTVLLLLLQMAIALVLTQLLHNYLLDESNPMEKRMRVFRYFGTFSKSMLTMFEYMLANWPPASRVLTEDVSEWYIIFILGYQCIIGFAVVKVIMGVFLQVTFNVASTDDLIMVNQRERVIKTHVRKMDVLFRAADQDGNGVLDKAEFREMVQDPVVRQWLGSMDCDVSLFARDPDALFELVDDGDEQLTAQELVKGMEKMKGPARSIDLAVLMDEHREIRNAVRTMSREVSRLKSRGFCDPDGRATSAASDARPGTGCGFLDQDRRMVPGEPVDVDDTGSPRSSEHDPKRKSIGQKMLGTLPTTKGRQRKSYDLSDKNWCQWAKFVLDPKFEGVFGSFIMLNAFIMGLEVQYKGIDVGYQLGYSDCPRSAQETWPWGENIFESLDWFFLSLFTLELTMKVICLRQEFIKDAWNYIDTVIVLCGIVDAVTRNLPMDPTLLRLARLTRLLRMLRLVRTLHGFDSLYLMTTSIKGSMSALLWSTVLMFVVQIMIALILSILLENYLVDPNNSDEERHLLYGYYGTFTKALLTMFEITLANWIPACRALTEHVSEWYMIFALLHKFIIGFAVVMVITGVFLQETFKVASTDDTIMINQKKRQVVTHTKKMTILFEAADKDGNGILDKDEWRDMINVPYVRTWLSSMGLDVEDADTVFSLVSREASQKDVITAAELVQGVAHLKGAAKSMDMAVMMRESQDLVQEVRELQRKVEDLEQRERHRNTVS